MSILDEIKRTSGEMTAWRRDLHAHPETGFEERRTSALVAEKLEAFGLRVHKGLGRTGVVGTLTAGNGKGAIGLRADMDALRLQEKNDFAHRSGTDGKMHGCGHDGHTAMLLGAAKYLAATKNFSGTVHFIFQPAEEGLGGGREMVEQGLFEKFRCDSVYGMHNWPALPFGQFGVRPGPLMASSDLFEIELTGCGCHAAMPHNAAAHGVKAALRYTRAYPPTVNSGREAAVCAAVLERLVGAENVVEPKPVMGSEDFSFMLGKKAGCYVFAGTGPGKGGAGLHSPDYDFNDALLPLGAAYWASLAEHILAV